MQSRTKAKLTAAVAAFTGSILTFGHYAMAQNDTWAVDTAGNGSGSFNTPGNWSTAAVPTGAATAFFNENITSTSTITLDGSQTLGTVNFGNTNASSNAGWVINTGTGGPLNLNNPGYNIFTVNQATGQTEVVTINATLANGNNGDNELAKGGRGTLVLTGNNSALSGTVAINDGVLELNFAAPGAPATNILGDDGAATPDAGSTHLEDQGGTLVLNGASGGTNSQTFSNGTGLELGDSSIVLNQNGAASLSLNLGLLQHNWASSLDIQLPTTGTVSLTLAATGGNQAFGTTTSTGGLLVDTGGMAFATVNNGADWAAVVTNTMTSTSSIVAGSSLPTFYTASTATTLSGNADVSGAVTLPASTNTTVTSLRFNGAATSIDIGGATNTLTTAGILMTPSATGNVTISDGNLVTSATNELFIDQNNATNTLTISANLTGGGDILKSGAGTLVLSGNDTQSGWNYLNSGTTVLAGGGTRGVEASAGDTYVGQAFGNTSTLDIVNGTWNSGRTVMAGNPGNYSGGTGTINQTGGTINSNYWFTVGGFGQGTYNNSGGVLNTNPLGFGVSELEIGVFTTGSGVVNLSGTGQINIDNNGTISFGDVNGNAAQTGVFNQNGGAVTFYSDGGSTVGGGGGINLGIGGVGTYTYNLNAGTLTVPTIGHSTGTAIFNFNGGTLQAAEATAGFMGGITHAYVQAGGANINTNGYNVTVSQPLSSGVTGPAVDGGLTKLGVGTLVLSVASTYTGATTITQGTVQLPAVGIPTAVASYSFDSFTPSSNPLPQNTVIPNTGSGGSALNGIIDNTYYTGGSTSGATIVSPGPTIGSLTTHALQLDGSGTDVLINSQIVDMSNAASWTFSAWIQTTVDGSAFLSKGTNNGSSWTTGNTVFYLGANPVSGTPGPYPTGVRYAGGFVQGTTPVDDGNWHMVTFVDAGGTETVYVDGNAVTSLTYPNMAGSDASNSTLIGYDEDALSDLDGNSNYAGNLDELNFFNTALSATQVNELKNTNSVSTAGGSQQILPATTPVNITASGASLDLNSENQSIGSLAGVAGSAVTLETGTLTTGGNNTSTAFAGSISGSGGLVKNGTGTQTLSGSNSYSGGTTVNAGELLIAANGALPDGALAITGGTAQLGHQTGLASLTSLSISGGIFDITNNHVLITYGASDPVGSIYAYLKSGFNNGGWNGATGIISSTAQTLTNGFRYGVGWADGADGTHNVAGLVSGEIELKYTLLGDANLDGSVNGSDFSILAANFGLGVTNWDQGNFLFSSSVNGSDFSALAANFGQGDSGADTSVTPADIAALDAFAAANNLAVPTIGAVPEPATTGILLMAATGLIARRRRRQE